MKKFLNCIYKALSFSGVAFFAIVMFFALFVFNTDTAHFTKETLMNFASFSAFVGIGALVFYIPRLPLFVSAVIHFLISGAGYFAFLLMTLEASTSSIFVGAFVFAAVYIAVFLLVKLLRIPFSQKISDKEDEMV